MCAVKATAWDQHGKSSSTLQICRRLLRLRVATQCQDRPCVAGRAVLADVMADVTAVRVVVDAIGIVAHMAAVDGTVVPAGNNQVGFP